MSNNSVFNMSVCTIGIVIFLIHIINTIIKKEKRKDERCLLDFLIFTTVHFATYLTFTAIKTVYTSNEYVITFYTIFYIMNNL